jgi:hypothetical protein
MSLKIDELFYRVMEQPRDFLTARNLIVVGCIGVIANLAITKVVETLIDYVDHKRKIPNLRNIFRQRYEPGLLKNMDNVLTNAMTNISFFGWRYITVPGYRGRISMEEAADRIEWLSKHQDNIFLEDRAIGQAFADKILDLYDRGDQKTKHKNFFTGMICELRDRHFDFFGVREYGYARWNGHTVFQRDN